MAFGLNASKGIVTLSAEGEESSAVTIDDRSALLRTANLIGDGSSEFLTFGVWGPTVGATGADGKLLWSYEEGEGVDDVWPADLDGDGLDEVIIGYNGGTGLHTLDNTGKLLWKYTDIGNVWHVTAGTIDADAGLRVFDDFGRRQGACLRFRRQAPAQSGIGILLAHDPRVAKSRRQDTLALVIVAGTGQPNERVAALGTDGKTRWSLELPTPVVNAATCIVRPWLAVSLADGTVQVVDMLEGKQIASVGSQGARTDMVWLVVDEIAPLLVVATGAHECLSHRGPAP